LRQVLPCYPTCSPITLWHYFRKGGKRWKSFIDADGATRADVQDSKALEYFPGRVVWKDLVSSLRGQLNVGIGKRI